MSLRLHAPGGVERPLRVRLDDDELEVVPDGPARLVDGAGRPRRLRVLDVGAHPVSRAGLAPGTLVYADRFADADVDRLRRARSQGVDRAGQVVVSGRDLTVVVLRPRAQGRSSGRTGLPALRATAERSGEPAVRGPVTARLVQLLLEHPGQAWSPTELATADGATTVATASRLLAGLRALGLLSIAAEGRWRRHHVTDPALLLDWLADRRDVRVRHRFAYLRARDTADLLDRLAARIAEASVPAVVTGAAAALAEGVPIATAVPVVTLRVATTGGAGLDGIHDALGLAAGGTGANVRLLDDTGLVGTHRPRVVGGVPLASPVRVWLDLRSERRGDALADLYRAEVLEDLLRTGTP